MMYESLRPEVINEVTCRLIGPIDAVGKTEVDSVRLQNMRNAASLVNLIIENLIEESKDVDTGMHSVDTSRKHARKILQSIVDELAQHDIVAERAESVLDLISQNERFRNVLEDFTRGPLQEPNWEKQVVLRSKQALGAWS